MQNVQKCELRSLAQFVYERDAEPEFGGADLVVDLVSAFKASQKFSTKVQTRFGEFEMTAEYCDDHTIECFVAGTIKIGVWLMLPGTQKSILVKSPIMPAEGARLGKVEGKDGTGLGYCFWIDRRKAAEKA